MLIEIKFKAMEAMAVALARDVADLLRVGVRMRGQASLAVSGGRTPLPFMDALSREKLEWSRVWVTQTDERWVAPDHADSNETTLRRHLLQNHAARTNFIGLKNVAASPLEGEAACEMALGKLPQPLDVVVLGMGDDGHTASLFPQAPQLAAALNMHSGKQCMAIDPVTAPHARMSLTLPALLASRRIVLLMNGSNKWDVYQRALEAGQVEALPIRAIIKQSQVPVEVYWSP